MPAAGSRPAASAARSPRAYCCRRSRPRHQTAITALGRLPQRPPSARGCGPWPTAATTPCSPRSAARPATWTPAKPHRRRRPPTSSPREPSPPASCANCATRRRAPRPSTRAPGRPAILFQLLTGATWMTPARPRVHHPQRPQPLPRFRRHPPHRAAGRAARPRRRLPARPGHRRAADLVPAAPLLHRLDLPGPEPDDIDLDAVGASSSPELPVAEAAARRAPGRPRPAALDASPARTPVGPVRRAPDMAAAAACPRHLDPESSTARHRRRQNLRQLEADTGIPCRPHPGRPRARITMTGQIGPAPPARASCPSRTSPAPAAPPSPATRFPATSAARPETARQAGAGCAGSRPP